MQIAPSASSKSNAKSSSKPSIEDSPGCITCTDKKFLTFARLIGFLPIAITCSHQNRKKISSFRISKTNCVICVILSALIFASLAFNIYDLFFLFDLSMKRLEFINLLNDTIYILIASLSSLFTLIQIKDKLKEVQALTSIVEQNLVYGLDLIFTKKTEKKINAIFYSTIVVANTFLIIVLIFNIHGVYSSEFVTWLNYVQLGFTYVAVLSIQVLLNQFSLRCLIYTSLMEELHDELTKILKPYHKPIEVEEITKDRKELRKRFGQELFNDPKLFNITIDYMQHQSKKPLQKIQKNDFKTTNLALCERLSKLRRLYSAYIVNINAFNDFYDPCKLIAITFILVSMVINIYLVIMVNFEEDSDTTVHIHSLMKLIGSLGMLILCLEAADRLRYSPEKILHYLYVYPISGLTYQEASEIEMFLELLYTQKPTLSASGAFDIGTKLLASISGAIVTYVMVALQFQIVWLDEGPNISPVTNSSDIA